VARRHSGRVLSKRNPLVAEAVERGIEVINTLGEPLPQLCVR